MTAEAIATICAALAGVAQKSGSHVSAEQIEAIAIMAVDALSGAAWREAKAAGQAAADSITTAAEAEAALRK